MGQIAIIYESKHGHTETIARRVGELVRARGHDAWVAPVAEADAVQLAGAAAVFVLAPIYVGKHSASLRAFVTSRAELLNARRSAFFSTCASAASASAEDRAPALAIARAFPESCGWHPAIVRSIAGALSYPKYNFVVRFVMKRIAKKHGSSTDTSRVHELTDWVEVERATDELLAALAPSRPAPQPVA